MCDEGGEESDMKQKTKRAVNSAAKQAKEMRAENARLRAQLAETEATLHALHEGAVAALPVRGSEGGRAFSLTETEKMTDQLEDRFRAAVETMPESFAIFSAVRDDLGNVVDFRYEYINESGARMNRRPRAEHPGKTILELLPAHKGTKLFADYIRITNEGGSIAEESLIYGDVYGGGEHLSRAFDIRATKLGDGFAVTWRDVTDRKKAEEKIEHLASFPRLNPNPVIGIDRRGVITFLNDAAAKAVAELGEGSDARIFLPDDINDLLKSLEQGGATHTVVREQNVGRRTFLETISLSGALNVLRIYAVDITARKQAEEALQQSEDRHRIALQAAELGTWQHDVASGIIRPDERARAHYGSNTDSISLDEVLAHIHPEDLERVRQEIARLLDPATSTDHYATEYRVVHQGGVLRWISVHAHVHFEGKDSARHAVLAVGTTQDITGRKRVEEEVRRHAEEIESVLKVSPVAIFIGHDAACTRITTNPAGSRLLNVPADPELNISKSGPAEERPTYRVFRDERELAAEDLPMQQAASTGSNVVEDELELRFDDGSRKFLFAHATPLFDAEGKQRGAVGAMLDITERRRAEELIQKHLRELQAMNDDLARFNKVAVGRELRMVELKKEINELSALVGQPPRYAIEFEKEKERG